MNIASESNTGALENASRVIRSYEIANKLPNKPLLICSVQYSLVQAVNVPWHFWPNVCV